jgi:hypothetical protein
MPQREKPEKISIDNVTWNSQAQAFDISLSSTFGAATAGDSAGFTVATTMKVGNVATLKIETPVQKADPNAPGGNDPVRLVPQRIAWDRNAGAFFGAADVTTNVELRNPSGESIGDGATTRSDLGVPISER